MKVEIIVPSMGESVAEATIINWLKQIGDTVEAQEPLVEIATDKVDTEIQSTVSGVVVAILVAKNDIAKVGDVVAIVETDSNAKNNNTTPNIVEKAPQNEATNIINSKSPILPPKYINAQLSPLVRSIANKEALPLEKVMQIKGSGSQGRIIKQDILNFIQEKKSPSPIIHEIIPMDRVRKLIARNMMLSKQISPHVTSIVEADVTNIVRWREKNKIIFEKKTGQKITYTPIFIQAVAQAIRAFPMINISVEEDNIIIKKNINIGMATATANGNLIVPIITRADTLNLLGLTEKVNDLAVRARQQQLKPEEIQGGTYTVTNIGTFGNILGTPIILQPQVAILAIGTIVKVPAVIETPQGDSIGIRHKMYLSHSYDHRVVDGALGGMFVKKVADILEAFAEPNF